MKNMSNQQRVLFLLLENCGELVFACGPRGVSANLVGKLSVHKNNHKEDQLNVGDGTNHVHIEWDRVKRFEVGSFHGEGVLTFFDGVEPLFKLYRLEGPFPKSIEDMAVNLFS